MRLRALVLAAVFWPACAVSQPLHFMSGNEIYEDCTGPKGSPKYGICIGYVVGISDALNMVGSVCASTSVTVDQVIDVIVNYIRANPKYRDVPASLLAGAALREAFPCY
jgi:hypothetical protein